MTWIQLPGARKLRVGKIICLARNYADHAKEMGGGVPEEPVFFLKPSTAIIHDGEPVRLPRQSRHVQGEAELAVVIGRQAKAGVRGDPLKSILGYAAFQDITARDLQMEARKTGQPWTMCKGFDTFAPVSAVMPAEEVGNPQDLRITLRLNGQIVQDARTADMVFPVTELLAYISSVMTLERGDILATGTPAGVPDLHPGDILETAVERVAAIRNPVVGPDEL
jgi:2-keto-4-pentenoate hydratase/2-oxohepta-3-ene-1,7-dioic acid hydratase in catechol pathway